MSVALMSLAFAADVSPTQKLVLLALCDSANDQGECYPAMQTLAEKCSLSERATQSAVSDLERTGHLRRELRRGRATVYWLTPAAGASRSSGESHYVYQVEDVESGEFYIGLRTCGGDPKADGYMGSGAWLSSRISDGRALKKSILQVFGSRQDAALFERQTVSQNLQDVLCMNKRTPAVPAPRSSCTPQQAHPFTPADAAPQGCISRTPQEMHPAADAPAPADAAPITITQTQPIPKTNTAPAAPTPKPDDWLTVEALMLDGLDADLAASWLAHRRAKKAKLTALAWRGFKAEADKAGWDYGAAVIKAIARNWIGFEAAWVADQRRPAAASKHSGFEAKNYREGVTEDGHIA